MEIIIQQVRVIDPATASDRIADVEIVGQQITAIAPQLSPGTGAVRDGRGLVLGPALVDLYSHCSEPGHEERETLAMLGAAALAGGYGRLALLPDTRPPPTIPRPWPCCWRELEEFLGFPDWGFGAD
ncbi:MAG: hypothetical protein HC890_18710 [Chloroflexaceae bacterium]|nr:hypothetical protein [Chloroflexaceae bacterium]